MVRETRRNEMSNVDSSRYEAGEKVTHKAEGYSGVVAADSAASGFGDNWISVWWTLRSGRIERRSDHVSAIARKG
tara:strand:+ start:3489 stop:3713 length:225 start_codon:yes stop_codon:yes gene_type:complete